MNKVCAKYFEEPLLVFSQHSQMLDCFEVSYCDVCAFRLAISALVLVVRAFGLIPRRLPNSCIHVSSPDVGKSAQSVPTLRAVT